MYTDYHIPEPFLFNPLKHHLGFIREFIFHKTDENSDTDNLSLIKELKHLGTSVMDVYKGPLSIDNICREVEKYLDRKEIILREPFSRWIGRSIDNFRVISLTDGSQWTLKYHDNNLRFIHLFPARGSQYSFRVKANTLKSALLYNIIIGKDYISGNDINNVRTMSGLSPIKDTIDTEAIMEMIELLRC